MRKRATIVIILAVCLAVGLWALHGISGRQEQHSAQKQLLEFWQGPVPVFRTQSVTRLYLVWPPEHTLYQLHHGQSAQTLLDGLTALPLDTAPTNQTRLGVLLEMDDQLYTYYLPNTAEAAPLVEQATQLLADSTPLVDVYFLLPASHIQSVSMTGMNKAADGTPDTRRQLTYFADQPEDIDRLLDILQQVEVESLTLHPPDKPVDLSELAASDGYQITFSLGEIYDWQSITVYGTRYGFTMSLDFQQEQRVYTVSYSTTKALLDGVEALSQTVVTPWEEGAVSAPPPEGSSSKEAASEEKADEARATAERPQETPPTEESAEASPAPAPDAGLPAEDSIPLPEGLAERLPRVEQG